MSGFGAYLGNFCLAENGINAIDTTIVLHREKRGIFKSARGRNRTGTVLIVFLQFKGLLRNNLFKLSRSIFCRSPRRDRSGIAKVYVARIATKESGKKTSENVQVVL